MDSQNARKLRWWLRRHPTAGPFVASGLIGLYYLWGQRRVTLITGTAIIGCAFSITLWLAHAPHFSASHAPVFTSARQPSGAAILPADTSGAVERAKSRARYRGWFSAAGEGDNPGLQRLLQEGIYVDATEEGGTALTRAAEHGHLSTVKLLMRAGANLHGCDRQSVLFDRSSNSALDGAAEGGHSQVVRYLLRKGFDPNGRDDNGYTPLLRGAASGNSVVVRLLLAAGARPNVQSRHFNYSSLMLASKAGAIDSVRALLRHGADARAVDADGHTAAWYVRRTGHRDILLLLNNAEAN